MAIREDEGVVKMSEKKTLYRCDPDRNKECRKTMCFRHGGFCGMVCRATTKPEFAARDEAGNLMEVTGDA